MKKKKNDVGTLKGIINILKEIFKKEQNGEDGDQNKEQKKQITKKDVIAVLLTIVVVVLIGVILWFIPFTNGWMRELLWQ